MIRQIRCQVEKTVALREGSKTYSRVYKSASFLSYICPEPYPVRLWIYCGSQHKSLCPQGWGVVGDLQLFVPLLVNYVISKENDCYCSSVGVQGCLTFQLVLVCYSPG